MMAMQFDSNNLVVQQDIFRDNGDQCARTFQYASGLGLRYISWLKSNTDEWPHGESLSDTVNYYFDARSKLIRADGVCLRSNRPGPGGQKYNDPFDKEWGTSRDQTMPAVIAAGIFSDIDTVNSIWNAVKKNWFRFPNGDIVTPENIATFARAGKWNLPYWKMSLLDFTTIINSIIINFKGALDPDNVGDDILHTQVLLFGRIHAPTDNLMSAIEIYKTRKAYLFLGRDFRNPKNYQPVPGNGPLYAFQHYFRPENGNNPQDELYRPLIEKYLSDDK